MKRSLIGPLVAFLLIGATAPAAHAGVFTVGFEDVINATTVGFDDPTPITPHPCGAVTLGELRRCTALKALGDLGNLINFHPNANPNILFEQSATSGPDPAGAASQFYALSLGNPQGGYLHAHITTGVDHSPAYDAHIKINVGATILNGLPTTMNSDYLVIDQSRVDLYTVVLHEAMHALGIGSLITGNGQSLISGSLAGPFSLFDQFLVLGGTATHILTAGPNPSFVGTPADLVSNRLEYLEPSNAIPRLPIVSPATFATGVSLSHFDRARPVANLAGVPYVGLNFDYVVGSGKPVRSVTNPELDVLCDLGYDLSTTCTDRYPIGINDAGPATTPGNTVCVNVLGNDIDPDSNPLAIDATCGVNIVNGNGPGASAVASGSQICYTPPPTFVGTAALSYCPSDGTRVGNPTQVTFAVTGTSCPGDPCNLICNGNLEGGVPDNTIIGFDAMKMCPSMVDNWCATIESPDLYNRFTPFPFVGNGIPNNFFSGSCPGGVNTWDFPASGNDRYVGMLFGQASEGMYTQLIQPLTPGATYTLSFHAITVNKGGSVTTPGELFMGFTSASPIPRVAPLDYSLPTQQISLCNGTNNWTAVNVTFTAPSTPNLNYFVVEALATQQPPLLDDYIYLDDFRLQGAGPPMSITKTVDNSTPMIGDTINYSIIVCNNGSVPATNVVIDDQLPAGLAAAGGTFTYPQHTVASLAPLTCVSLTLQAQVTLSATAGIPLTNCASVVSGGNSCGTTSNNCVDIVIPSNSSISGQKWNDLDGDGVKDLGEPGLSGWTIVLTDAAGNQYTAVTNALGNYSFANLPPGNYLGSEVAVFGWTQTFPPSGTHTLLLAPGTALSGIDFGNHQPANPKDCSFSQGYWENHPSAWPTNNLTLGTVTYNKVQLLSILGQPVKGNGLVSLAHQLIAADLNIVSGASEPAAIAAAITQANLIIGNKRIPPVGSGSVPTSSVSSLVTILDNYNNGRAAGGPPHCD